MAWRSNLQEADCERRIVFIGVRAPFSQQKGANDVLKK